MYKAYRAALEALRREFQSAGDRYPGLFYEGFGTPDSVFYSNDPWQPVWAAFIAANHAKDERIWEEWYISVTSDACGRFYGDGGGIEIFKRLAESLALVLCQMGEIEEENCNYFECLQAMYGAAADYPTPLLRTKDRTWGVEDNPCLDKEALGALHEEMSESAEGELCYPVHPFCSGFVHDLFTSAVAFIDILLDPEIALRVSGGYTQKPPISLKKPAGDNQGTATDSVGQDSEDEVPADDGVAESEDSTCDYLLAFDARKGVWHVRYRWGDNPTDVEEGGLPDKKFVQYLAYLLERPNQWLDCTTILPPLVTEGGGSVVAADKVESEDADDRPARRRNDNDEDNDAGRKAYEAGLRELAAKKREAMEAGDEEEVVNIEKQFAAVMKEYHSEYDKDGRPRALPTRNLLAANRVRSAIGHCQTVLMKRKPPLSHLAKHLAKIDVSRGSCSYIIKNALPWKFVWPQGQS